MTKVDHARLVQALRDTSNLVACNIGPERHSVATQKLQRSIAMLLAELNKDWCDVIPQNTAQPSVGIPD
jgi:phenylalanyl-tRNA synthetase beta subunit